MKNLLTITIIIFYCSCKDKLRSNYLVSRNYRIEMMQIDGQPALLDAELDFKPCKIKKELCEGVWHRPNVGKCEFYWQINNNGKELILANKTQMEIIPSNFPDLNAVLDCYNMSGIYLLKKQKDGSFNLETNQAKGYLNKTVNFKLVPN